MLKDSGCIRKICGWCKQDSLHTPMGRYCKSCVKERSYRYRVNNLEKVKTRELNRVLSGKKAQDMRAFILRSYNMTINDYAQLFNSQNGLCAICNLPSIKSLAVDHCHTTGKVRGLLCDKCNWGIGHFEDKISSLIEAIDYLNKSTINE